MSGDDLLSGLSYRGIRGEKTIRILGLPSVEVYGIWGMIRMTPITSPNLGLSAYSAYSLLNSAYFYSVLLDSFLGFVSSATP